MSSSALRSRRKVSEESDESLPEEWGSVQKRLEYLQTAMVKLQKKTQRCENKVNQNEEELSFFQRDFKKNIDQVFALLGKDTSLREREMEMDNIRQEISDLHALIKRIEKKSNEMFKQLKNNMEHGFGANIDQFTFEDKIDEKIQKMQLKNKNYVDRVVSQMKATMKTYPRQINNVENKYSFNDIQKSQPKSKPFSLKNSQKVLKTSQLKIGQLNDKNNTSYDEKMRQRSPKSVQNVGSSRVSYLRQRLREFQQINKKYDQKSDMKQVRKEQDRGTVQKMKEFKNYLEQSQSQLQPSNFQIKDNHVLSDSIKRWRSNNNYALE